MKLHGRRTKIIATMGPALLEGKILTKALTKIDALRFNFSHLTIASAKQQLKLVKAALAAQADPRLDVALIADLKGPEIRTDAGTHILKRNATVVFHCKQPPLLEPTKATKLAKLADAVIFLDHPRLQRLVSRGQRLTVDDGALSFKVLKTGRQTITAKVTIGGKLGGNKTVNVPGVELHLPILGKRDQENLTYICKERFNWVAASFISSARDVQIIRTFIKKHNPQLQIIAKIENTAAVKNIKDIVAATDGVMVARGDLGENLPYEQLPALQELILTEAQNQGKVVIVATQMLETLMKHPLPKRPEVTDVATAVRARVDAVMLSGETASGQYPLEAINVMHKIIKESERTWQHNKLFTYTSSVLILPVIQQALALAKQLAAKYVIAITTRGKSPRLLASLRPQTHSIVACYHRAVFERSHLYYAVTPLLIDKALNKEVELQSILEKFKSSKKLKRGDNVVFVFGYPFKLYPTNTIRWIKLS